MSMDFETAAQLIALAVALYAMYVSLAKDSS